MKTLKAENLDCQTIQNGLRNYGLNIADGCSISHWRNCLCFCCRLVSDFFFIFTPNIESQRK